MTRSTRRLCGAAGMVIGLGAFGGLFGGPVGGHSAEASPLGDEIQLNAATAGDQLRPDIAATSTGFTVVWQSPVSPGNDLDGAVVGRRFDAEGTPVAGEFQVNLDTTYPQRTPRIDTRADGSAVITWTTTFIGGKGPLGAIAARPFDAAGAGAGQQFQVDVAPNIYTAVLSHDVAADDADGFVVVTSEFYNNNSTYTGEASYRRVAADGSVLGGTTLDVRSGEELSARVDGGGGGFVITWSRREYFGTYGFVRAQMLDASGVQEGSTLEPSLGQNLGGTQGADGVRLASGELQIAWDGYEAFTGFQREAYGRRLSAAGVPDPGGPVQLNTAAEGLGGPPRIATADGDFFLVVWAVRDHPDDAGLGLRGRWLGRDGAPVAREMAINSQTGGDQRFPEIAAAPDGERFLVVWQSEDGGGVDTDGSGIRGRLFAAPIFVDGFESGDTSAWSAEIP